MTNTSDSKNSRVDDLITCVLKEKDSLVNELQGQKVTLMAILNDGSRVFVEQLRSRLPDMLLIDGFDPETKIQAKIITHFQNVQFRLDAFDSGRDKGPIGF